MPAVDHSFADKPKEKESSADNVEMKNGDVQNIQNQLKYPSRKRDKSPMKNAWSLLDTFAVIII